MSQPSESTLFSSIKVPPATELEPELKKFIDPSNEKAALMTAKGLAPLPPAVLVSAWSFYALGTNAVLKQAALESIQAYPERSLASVLGGKIPSWALHFVGILFSENENLLELVLLNENTPNEVFLAVAANCSERLTTIIANNQERIIECPELIPLLEKNPENLKSNTDRLRQFLRLAGIFVPGGEAAAQAPAPTPEAPKSESPPTVDERAQLAEEESLSEEKRQSLHNYIQTLTTGAKVKLALKGNKEARGILVRDTNKTVATAVLRSPRITENEIVVFSSLKQLSEDVIRDISRNPFWTKNYGIKLNLVNHPKTPLQDSMGYIKFLSLRDLTDVARSKTTPPPLRKAAKQLLNVKRK